MAIVAVKQFEEESGDQRSNGKLTTDGSRRYRVITDSGDTQEGEVLQAAGIPQPGEAHPRNGSFVSRRRAERVGVSFTWIVTIDYAQEDQAGGGGEEPDPNDASSKPVLRFGTTQKTVYKDHDYLGAQLVNSAGAKFDDADAVDETFITITISNFRVGYDVVTPALVNAYSGAVHGQDLVARFTQTPLPANLPQVGPPFFTFIDYVVRCSVDFQTVLITTTTNTHNEWEGTLNFTVADTWLGTALDQGTYKATVNFSQGVVQSIADRTPILDSNNVPVRKPVLLNGAGAKLENGQPFYRVWQKYKHTNLNNLLTALGLPTTIAGYKVVIT